MNLNPPFFMVDPPFLILNRHQAPGGFPLFFGLRSALRLWMGVRKSRAASINLKGGLSWPDTSVLNLPMIVALANQQVGPWDTK